MTALDPHHHASTFLGSRNTETQRSTHWSARRTLGFIVATCGAFWIGVAFIIMKLA